MKKLMAFMISFSLIATPMAAMAHSKERRHKHDDTALVIGLLLGGIILDRAVNRRYEERDEYRDEYRDDRYEPRPTQCWQVRAYDYYGRPYLRTVCER